MDVAGLHPNTPHGEDLASLYKFLETRENKQILNDTLAELTEIVLKNNSFEFDEKLSNKNVEPLLEGSLHLLMLFFLRLISRKKCWKFLKKKQ